MKRLTDLEAGTPSARPHASLLKSAMQAESPVACPFNPQGLRALARKHENQVKNQEERREKLSDQDLRIELEQQYGTSNWAKKVVDEILSARIWAVLGKAQSSR